MIEIYTDGACSKNPGPGGWAFVVVEQGIATYNAGGSEKHTTNNRMELTAILEACKYIDTQPEGRWTIYADSAYCINCYSAGWRRKWMENGWMTSQNKPVLNQDLWEKLIPYFRRSDISFCKVKGHANNQFNNIVDELAVSWRMENELYVVYQCRWFSSLWKIHFCIILQRNYW